LEEQLREVFQQNVNRVSPATAVVGITRPDIRVSVATALLLVFRALVAAVRMGRLAARTGVLGTTPAVLAAVGRLDAIVEYLYNRRTCEFIASNARAVLTLNENWLPESQLIRAANMRGVPTLHYPHGLIGPLVLPLVSSHQLFWNDRMAESFGRDHPGRIATVGFLEGYRLPPPPAIELRYDVLITSQYHGYRLGLTDDPAALGDLFRVWAEVVESDPALRCVVKLHPADSDADRQDIAGHFARVIDRVLILGGGVDLRWLMAGCRVHSTVSSGSVVTGVQFGKRTVLYGESALIRANLPDQFAHFRTADELHAILRADDWASPPEWVAGDWIDRQVSQTVAGLLGPSLDPLPQSPEPPTCRHAL
jgi:hypothetical protein